MSDCSTICREQNVWGKALVLFSTHTKGINCYSLVACQKETLRTLFFFSRWRLENDRMKHRKTDLEAFIPGDGWKRHWETGYQWLRKRQDKTFKFYLKTWKGRRSPCVSLIGPGKTRHLRHLRSQEGFSGERSLSSWRRQLWETLSKQLTNGATLLDANESPNYIRQSIQGWRGWFGGYDSPFLNEQMSQVAWRKNLWTDRFPPWAAKDYNAMDKRHTWIEREWKREVRKTVKSPGVGWNEARKGPLSPEKGCCRR